MSSEQASVPSVLRPLLAIAAVVVILAGMWAASSIVNLVLMAGLLTLLCIPIRNWLIGRGMKRWLALTLIIGGALLLSVLLIALIGFSIGQVAQNSSGYQDGIASQSGQITAALQQRGIDASTFDSTAKSAASLIFGTLASIAGNLVGLLTFGAFALLLFGYMLAESESLTARLHTVIPADNPGLIRASQATSSVAKYMLMLTVVNLTIAVADMLFLWLLGIPHVLLWGILAFVFGYIPYIGYWVSILPPLFLGFLQGGVVTALIIILGYWFINGMLSTVIAPRFYGKGLNLSPTITLLAVLFWGFLLGPIGGIVGVPLTALIKSTALDGYEGTRWLAAALSTGDGTSNET